jgi:tungstate transport system ATP-binding protein
VSTAPLVAVRGLEVGYGRRGEGFTLRVPDLELRASSVLAVLGPNGSGKSTLLRAMAGLLRPRHGSVSIAPGCDAALVFQRPLTLAGTVAYNAELALFARGMRRAERRARAAAALEELGIAHLAARSAATLSGGELRRLALARAFAQEPRVLLLDEPFDDLDVAGREALSLDLARALAERRVAVALVSHDLAQALLLADRLTVLVGGELAQTGERDEVLRRPASVEIARLVGMSNLLPGRVLSRDAAGLAVVELASGARLRVAGRHTSGSDVWAGVRPESVKLGEAHGEAAPSPLVGRARVLRLVSDGVLATAWLDWEGMELRTHLVAGRGLGASLKSGDAVAFSVRPEDVHLLARAERGVGTL